MIKFKYNLYLIINIMHLLELFKLNEKFKKN